MPKPKTIEIDSWGTLNDVVEAHSDQAINGTPVTKWLYRGVTSADYELVPKIGRPHARTRFDYDRTKRMMVAISEPYDAVGEIKAFEQFKRLAHPHLSSITMNSWEWLAVAQHHGLPTRLLDWSENPLVAAYFAVERSGTSGDAAIYAIRRPDPVNGEPFKLKVEGYLEVPHLAPRIAAQSGVFTAHPHPPTPYEPAGVRKWVIKSGVCFRIREMLETCGVNRARLFPDVDGIAQYLEWRYKWGKW